ncbi:MAG: transcriptional repressor [Myxococcota bacterium]|nr:transcriptional repressor [Myxococcota bacterium]
MAYSAHITESLRDKGLVLTSQRRRILDYLDGNMQHPTAAQIHKAVSPGVTLSTVYNTLALLKDHGLVRELPQQGGEARFDPNPEPHHHLECVDCGALHDLPATAVKVELLLDAKVEQAQVSFLGHCPGGCEG